MRRRRADTERGIALISVLWVGVVLGALAAAALALGRGDLDRAGQELLAALLVEAGAASAKAGELAAASDLLRIRAEAEGEDGARAARAAVVSLRARSRSAYSVLAWRQETPVLFPAGQFTVATGESRPPSELRRAPARVGATR